jgi:hypothetical protein
VAQTRAEVVQETHASPVDEDLARLRRLVEQGDVEGARAFVKVLEERWPDSPSVRQHARVLAPPVARIARDEPNRSFEAEYLWLRQHAHDYPGCWLAVLGDRLIAADPDPRTVLKVIRETPEAGRALLHFQPGLSS